MSDILLNIVLGLATSILSGGSVWTWQRANETRALRGRTTFFGLRPGGLCLIVMNHKYDKPGSTAHADVHALIEVATLAKELGARISVRSCDEMRESNADRTEFCIGGPESNPRTAGHLAAHLPGVAVRPYHVTRQDSGAIVVGDRQFLLERGERERALVAKFTPAGASQPVFLICGQAPVTNQAAVHYLKREHRALMKSLESIDQFCLVILVVSPKVYGHEAVSLEADVTAAAFTGHHSAAIAAGN
jgi:hypothetical protein